MARRRAARARRWVGVDSNAGKLDAVIDKAGDLVDEKTGKKYASQVDTAQDAAEKALRKQ
ncbi:antitoxin [Nocardia abscessus]|uniref:Antitoxin n=1 Tax=Nocardia abscessus TaxID=120957 RepID=A0ABS0C4P9_9NOCA|nr:antitoxin [Nocardia abscessus]MBF6224448.1 antitoxin [Nocardia abscessus]